MGDSLREYVSNSDPFLDDNILGYPSLLSLNKQLIVDIVENLVGNSHLLRLAQRSWIRCSLVWYSVDFQKLNHIEPFK